MLLEGKLGKELSNLLQEHLGHRIILIVYCYGTRPHSFSSETWVECEDCSESLVGAKVFDKRAKKKPQKNRRKNG